LACVRVVYELSDRVEAPKVNWEARAVKSFSMAELEARKLKYPNTGTESLLLGILTEGKAFLFATAKSWSTEVLWIACFECLLIWLVVYRYK